MLKTLVMDFLVFKPEFSRRLSRIFFSASSRLSRNFRGRLAGLAQIAAAGRLSRRLRGLVVIEKNISILVINYRRAMSPFSLLLCMSFIRVYQWCTTFFGQGPLIDFLNPSGARQVRRLPLRPVNEYMLKFKKMSCAVKHKVSLKNYREEDSLLLHYCNVRAFSNDSNGQWPLTLNLKWHTSLILQQLADLDSKVKSKNQLDYHPVNHASAFKASNSEQAREI